MTYLGIYKQRSIITSKKVGDSIADVIIRNVARIASRAFRDKSWHNAGVYVSALIYYAESRCDQPLIEKLQQVLLLHMQQDYLKAKRCFRDLKPEIIKKYNK